MSEVDEVAANLRAVEEALRCLRAGKWLDTDKVLADLRIKLEDKWMTAMRNETRDTTPAPQCVCPYQCPVHVPPETA